MLFKKQKEINETVERKLSKLSERVNSNNRDLVKVLELMKETENAIYERVEKIEFDSMSRANANTTSIEKLEVMVKELKDRQSAMEQALAKLTEHHTNTRERLKNLVSGHNAVVSRINEIAEATRDLAGEAKKSSEGFKRTVAALDSFLEKVKISKVSPFSDWFMPIREFLEKTKNRS